MQLTSVTGMSETYPCNMNIPDAGVVDKPGKLVLFIMY